MTPSLDRSISAVPVLAIKMGIAGRADIKLSATKRNYSDAVIETAGNKENVSWINRKKAFTLLELV